MKIFLGLKQILRIIVWGKMRYNETNDPKDLRLVDKLSTLYNEETKKKDPEKQTGQGVQPSDQEQGSVRKVRNKKS